MSKNFLTGTGMEYVGFSALVYLGLRISAASLSYFYRRFLARPFNVKNSGGDWAIVTGATDGIGKAYAFALAKRGLNIILVSRTPFKLQNVAADIESKYLGIRTKIIDVDFSSSHETYIPRIEEAIRGLNIGVLVNNVGMSYDHPEPFLNTSSEMVNKLILCNIVSVNEMTRLILPQMVERKKGAIINLASLGGAMCTPLLSVYSATKAYVDRFTEGLEYEYGRKGITVQCIMPGYVVSNMSKIRRANMMAPMPDKFVASALSRLGIESRTTGYWFHDLMLWGIGSLMPGCLSKYLTYNELLAIRAKALKKLGKDN
jgi:17beta-estradiol 17-dehydrogenase / very-long-chain 3-oxoacyl-CoA reductase